MTSLANNEDYKFLRYRGFDVDSVYNRNYKLYGKNLWMFPNSGSNDYGSNLVENMDQQIPSQHYKFTVTGLKSNMWSRLIQGLYPNGTSTTYNTNLEYTTSFWIKSSLNKIRIYLYLGNLASNAPLINNTNWVNYLLNIEPNIWTFVHVTRKPANTDAIITNKNLIGFRYLQGDHPDINLIGQTVEVKNIKTELGPLSPYSIHKNLLKI